MTLRDECINRNIVECKGNGAGIWSSFPSVLIETLWNVKMNLQLFAEGDDAVLIETLWNVKRNIPDT